MGESYQAEDIHVLENIEAVRKRPGMYIGDTGTKGFHHLLYEVMDNSVDEHLVGNCYNIIISIGKNGSISIEDDGAGIPVGMHDSGLSAVEVVFTKLHAGAKFGDKDSPYKISGGLHGVGVTAVNAMSEKLQVYVKRDGGLYFIEFQRGMVTKSLSKLKDINNKEHGTKVIFWPDKSIFGELEFDYETIANRCRELSFLNSGLNIELIDERTGESETFYTEEGVIKYVDYLTENNKTILDKPLYIKDEAETKYGKMIIEIAFQYTDQDNEKIYSYCNNIHTMDGGTHVTGFKHAITSSLNLIYKQNKDKFRQKSPIPEGKDYRSGLVAVISLRYPNPSFESQTKVKLVNPEITGHISSIVGSKLKQIYEWYPESIKKIINKAIISAKIRVAMNNAVNNVKRKNLMTSIGLPGKLSDCSSRNSEETELFIVEGDSAGGSAKLGRDSSIQAILALRGKILNVQRSTINKVFNNNEIKNIIRAIGTGTGDDFNDNKRRYGKIIIMTDADIDGSHIRTLLLTFFYNYMKQLIEDKRLYIAQPPLYKFVHKRTKSKKYVNSYEEKIRALLGWGIKHVKNIIIDDNKVNNFTNSIINNLIQLELIKHDFINKFISFENYHKMGFPELLILNGTDIKPIYDIDMMELDEDDTLYDFSEISDKITKIIDSLNSININMMNLYDGKYVLETDNNNYEFDNLFDVINQIYKLGENDIYISRFKGLGEMDAEELWETTLDPTRRSLYQVHMEDAKSADEVFKKLMGSEVSIRYEFIVSNAHKVQNLDV